MMKEGVLKGARSLIEHHKKTANQDPFINLIADTTNRLEKEFFEQDDDDNSFNLISEVSEIKNRSNGKKKKTVKY